MSGALGRMRRFGHARRALTRNAGAVDLERILTRNVREILDLERAPWRVRREPLPAWPAASTARSGVVRRAGDAHVHMVVVAQAVARLDHYGLRPRNELIRFAQRA